MWWCKRGGGRKGSGEGLFYLSDWHYNDMDFGLLNKPSGPFIVLMRESELVGYQSALVMFPVKVLPEVFQVHRILREVENTPKPV